MSVLFFDLETQYLAQDPEVGGWKHIDRMKMSIGVVYNETTQQFKVYREEEVGQLINDLKNASLVIGFNIINFDYEVLKGYGYTDADFAQIKTFDILDYILRKYGFRKSLDNIAKATLHQHKCADGKQAVQWFKEGNFDKLITYCKKDVEITRDIFYFGEKNWHIKYWDERSANPKRLDVEWAGMRPSPNTAGRNGPIPLTPAQAIELLERENHNTGDNNMNKILILATNFSNTYWSQEPQAAPYQLRHIANAGVNIDELQLQLTHQPISAIGIYTNGHNGNFTNVPFQFMRVTGITTDGINACFHTQSICGAGNPENVASNQIQPHFPLVRVVEPNTIINQLQQLGVTPCAEWLALVNGQAPVISWQDWIGEHFKKLKSNNISNNDFEDIVADIFRALGFEVEQMGHQKPGAFSDGILKTPPQLGFAVVYDCKNSNNYYPNAGDKRAIQEYLEREQRRLREREPNLRVYSLFIAKSLADNWPQEIAGISVDNLLYLFYKRLKLGNKFSFIPFEEACKQQPIDKQFIDDKWRE